MEKTGEVIEVISAVLDIRFGNGEIPKINEQIFVEGRNGLLTVEAA